MRKFEFITGTCLARQHSYYEAICGSTCIIMCKNCCSIKMKSEKLESLKTKTPVLLQFLTMSTSSFIRNPRYRLSAVCCQITQNKVQRKPFLQNFPHLILKISRLTCSIHPDQLTQAPHTTNTQTKMITTNAQTKMISKWQNITHT